MAFQYTGTDQDDVLEGTEGHNMFSGLGGNDVLKGLGGDDVLSGGPGHDVLDGGPGRDTAYYLDNQNPIIVALNGLQNAILSVYDKRTGESYPEDTLRNIEDIQATAHNDIITGDHFVNYFNGYLGNDVLRGESGDDHLYGYEGDDILQGDDGNDVLWGHLGNDILRGGDGDDLLYGDGGDDIQDGGDGQDCATYVGSSGPVHVTLEGSTSVPVFVDGTVKGHVSNIEGITGSIFNDVLIGDGHNNYLIGNEGDDILSGKGGDDVLEGLDGDDTLRGGGADRFMYDPFSFGTDTIVDFSRSEGDRIVLVEGSRVSIVEKYGDAQADSLVRIDPDSDYPTMDIAVVVQGVPDLTMTDILIS